LFSLIGVKHFYFGRVSVCLQIPTSNEYVRSCW